MQVLNRWSWGLPQPRHLQMRRGLVRVLVAVVVLWAGYGLLAGDAGLLRIMSLTRRSEALEAEVARMGSETTAIRRQRELLLGEPAYLEKVAREEYGLAREKEIVFRFDGGAVETGSLAALFPDSLRQRLAKEAAKPAKAAKAAAPTKAKRGERPPPHTQRTPHPSRHCSIARRERTIVGDDR